jgi:hypothetical protein
MADAIVKDSHLRFLGIKYFRGGSASVSVADFGEIKRPVFGVNFLDVQGRVPVPKLKIQKATEVAIDFSETTEKEFLANINVPLVFKGSAQTAYQDTKSGKLKLVMFEIDNGDLQDAINASPNCLKALIDLGDDARICDTVFSVMKAELASSFTSSTTFDVSATVEGVKVTANARSGASGSASIVFEKGMTFGYGLVKIQWDANLKKNRTKIEKLSVDQWGL